MKNIIIGLFLLFSISALANDNLWMKDADLFEIFHATLSPSVDIINEWWVSKNGQVIHVGMDNPKDFPSYRKALAWVESAYEVKKMVSRTPEKTIFYARSIPGKKLNMIGEKERKEIAANKAGGIFVLGLIIAIPLGILVIKLIEMIPYRWKDIKGKCDI